MNVKSKLKIILPIYLCVTSIACSNENAEYDRVLAACTPGAAYFKEGQYHSAFEKWWDPSPAIRKDPKERLRSVILCLRITGLANNDDELAAQLIKVAATENSEGQMYVGMLYANGQGVNKDINKALEWWEIASKNGNKDAQKLLKMLEKEMSKKEKMGSDSN